MGLNEDLGDRENVGNASLSAPKIATKTDEPTYEDLVGEEVAHDEDLEEDAKLKAHDLFLRLQSSFSAPNYITLEEVRDATGFDGQRTADAMAISLYRSRGKALWGFEFKVSRSDWLHELKQPEKSESILRFCDYWALVVPNKDLVKVGELPPTWGMYVAQKNRLKCVVPCPKLDPVPLDRIMLTALAYAIDRRQAKVDKVALDAARDEGYKQGVSRSGSDYYEKSYRTLLGKVEEYEKASGLDIRYGWTSPDKIGGIVSQILSGDKNLKSILHDVHFSLKSNERLKTLLEEQAKELEAFLGRKSEEETE
jgi:hypothetical protein